MGAVKRAVNRGIKAVKNPLKTVKDVVKNPLKEVRETADIVGDFVSETVDITNKGVKALTGTDLIENVSNMTEEAWENDAVKAAAIVATGAYLAGVGPFAAAGTTATTTATAGAGAGGITGTYAGITGNTALAAQVGGTGAYGAAAATTATSSGIGATLSSVGSSLLAGAADLGKTVATEVGKGVATAYTTQALMGGGGGGGGGFASPSVRLSKGADSVYSEFRARQVNFGIDPRVAQSMQRIAQSNQEELVAFREDATRVASGGVTLNLGSVTTGGVGVRSTTGVS